MSKPDAVANKTFKQNICKWDTSLLKSELNDDYL